MAGSIGIGPTNGSGSELAEENRKLRAELDALKQAARPASGGGPHAASPHAPRPPPGPAAAASPRVVDADAGLVSAEFTTPRGKAAKDAINDDVTHEFFSAHERNTALNVQRDIRQSCKIAGDRRQKLDDAADILHRARAAVAGSGDATKEELRTRFDDFRGTLARREAQFAVDLERHRRGEAVKIQKEQRIVRALLTTLDNLIREAQDVMTGPRDAGSDGAGDYKTLAEIKDEFTELRQVLLPWDMGYLFDKITAKASEQMIDIRTTAVHDIVAGLIETLLAARDKAEATFETLNRFENEVERVVPETMGRVNAEFDHFRAVTREKERLFGEKVEHYNQIYSDRIQTEIQFVAEWVQRLDQQLQASHEAVQAGNDHQLLRQLETLNQALVQIDGSTLTLGYDRIGFTPCRSVLACALDQLGVLQREEIECRPLFGNYFHYYQFLEHKEFMYGGSEVAPCEPERADADPLAGRERDMFTAAFRKVDRDKNGYIDAAELAQVWADVFARAPRGSVESLTRRIFAEIDTNRNGKIHFSEFLDYLSDGMRTNLGAQRDMFYRPGA